jgi:hypothetical protein
VSLERCGHPGVVFYLENTNCSIACSRVQFQAIMTWCPFDKVDGALMELVLSDLNPFAFLLLEDCDLFLEASDCD